MPTERFATVDDIQPWEKSNGDLLSPRWDLRPALRKIVEISEPGTMRDGELREVEWPLEEDRGVRDFRLQRPDGRRVAIQTAGPPDGYPILFTHGSPSSRVCALPSYEHLEQLGFRIISWDREGYGMSDPYPHGRTVLDVGKDAVAVVSAMIPGQPFSMVARSGGCPTALAAATLFGRELERTVILNPPAPPEAAETLLEGMGQTNGECLRLSAAGLQEKIRREADAIRRDPCAQLRLIQNDFERHDRSVLRSPQVLARVAMSHWLGIARGIQGWVHDSLVWLPDSGGWGFDLQDVSGDVHLWCGGVDRFTPPSHTYWLAERIPEAKVIVEDVGTHFLSMDLWAVLMHYFNDKIR